MQFCVGFCNALLQEKKFVLMTAQIKFKLITKNFSKFCVSFNKVNGKKKLCTALTNVQIEDMMQLKIAH